MSSGSVDDVDRLLKFLASRQAVSVVDALSIVARVVENAARPDADSPSAIDAARKVLSDLQQTPSSDAVPILLHICSSHARSPVLDVFILTSQAWKALVAAFTRDDASFSPQTGFGVVECALQSALMMLVRAVSAQHGIRCSDVPDITRSLKITKFYCYNAARCSKVLLSSRNRGKPAMDYYVDALSSAMQLVAITSHILHFDPVLDSSALSTMQQQICPLIGSTLTSIMDMVHQDTAVAPSSDAAEFLVKCCNKIAVTSNFLATCFEDIAIPSFTMLAVLHVMRVEVSETAEAATKGAHQLTLNDRRWSLFRDCVLPSFFRLCWEAYAELVLLRERATGQTYLDFVTSSAAQCIVSACSLRPEGDDQYDMTIFLLKQVGANNPVSSYIAHQSLLHMYDNSFNNFNRMNFIAVLIKYVQIAFALDSTYLQTRWIPLVTEILAKHIALFGVKKGISQFLGWESAKGDIDHKKRSSNPPHQLMLQILSSLLTHLQHEQRESKSLGDCQRTNVIGEDEKTLFHNLVILLGCEHQTSEARDKVKNEICMLCSALCPAEWAFPLLPYVLDAKSANKKALEAISQEGTLPVVCAALNILQPSSMTSKDFEVVCKLSGSLQENYGYACGPALAAFVARSSSMLHESVSVADWQYLSQTLDNTVIRVMALATRQARWSVISTLTMYHAAMTLSNIRSRSVPENDRKTLITLSRRVLPLAEDALETINVSKQARLTLGGRGLVNERMAAEREIRIFKSRGQCFRPNSVTPDFQLAQSMQGARLDICETLCDLLNNPDDEENDHVKLEIRKLRLLLDSASQLMWDAESSEDEDEDNSLCNHNKLNGNL